LQAGAIAEIEPGIFRALKKFYIPEALDERTLATMSLILFPVISGMAHNLRTDRPPQGFLQRFAYSDTLSEPALTAFRTWARSRAASFLEEANEWIGANEQRVPPASGKPLPDAQAGLGVFYYEGPSIGTVIASSDHDVV
jgi:hypothetical protein